MLTGVIRLSTCSFLNHCSVGCDDSVHEVVAVQCCEGRLTVSTAKSQNVIVHPQQPDAATC